VELHDYAPAEHLADHLQSADVHLVSLDTAWTGTMVPSKLPGIFGVARPVVFIGSAASSIGQWVLASGGGWVVEAGDVPSLLAALAEASDPAVRAARGHAAKTFANANFDQRANVDRVTKILTRAH
jgi:colanic acid biosynthesis glycosyl transferase WcaI